MSVNAVTDITLTPVNAWITRNRRRSVSTFINMAAALTMGNAYLRCLISTYPLIAFCDSFNRRIYILSFVIRNFVFITLHYDWVFFPFKDISVPNIHNIRNTPIYDQVITYIDTMADICVAAHLSGKHYLEETVKKYLSLKDNTTQMEHKPQITMNRTTQITILIDKSKIPIRG